MLIINGLIMTIQYYKNLTDTLFCRRVCLKERCGESFWIANLNYRTWSYVPEDMPSNNSTDGTTETLDPFDDTDCESTTYIVETETEQVATVPSVTPSDNVGPAGKMSTDRVSTENTPEITVITTDIYLTSEEHTTTRTVTVSTSSTSYEEATTNDNDNRKKRYLKDQMYTHSVHEISQYKFGPGFVGALIFSIINLGKYIQCFIPFYQ